MVLATRMGKALSNWMGLHYVLTSLLLAVLAWLGVSIGIVFYAENYNFGVIQNQWFAISQWAAIGVFVISFWVGRTVMRNHCDRARLALLYDHENAEELVRKCPKLKGRVAKKSRK